MRLVLKRLGRRRRTMGALIKMLTALEQSSAAGRAH